MSLSSHLRDKRSPVRAWLVETFPHTRAVATEANRELCGSASRCLIPAPPGSDISLVGTGIDYLLRACLQVDSLETTAASRSARGLSSQGPRLDDTASVIEREAVQRIRALQPDSGELIGPEWTELCRLCLVLARFEQHGRIPGFNPAVFRFLIQPLSRCRELDELVPLAITEPSIRDLERLGRSAWEDQRHLRKARTLHLNPGFALSSALGGADADLIAEQRLIDWKATTTRKVVGWEPLWQLLGYALADTDDEYEIHEVGITALRWRSSIYWSLSELIAKLSLGRSGAVFGKSVEFQPFDFNALRAEFAQVVESARDSELAARQVRLEAKNKRQGKNSSRDEA